MVELTWLRTPRGGDEGPRKFALHSMPPICVLALPEIRKITLAATVERRSVPGRNHFRAGNKIVNTPARAKACPNVENGK